MLENTFISEYPELAPEYEKLINLPSWSTIQPRSDVPLFFGFACLPANVYGTPQGQIIGVGVTVNEMLFNSINFVGAVTYYPVL